MISIMPEYFKKLIIAVLIFMALAAAINFGFLWKNIKFYLAKPDVKTTEEKAARQPNRLFIDSLDISVPVIYVSQKNEAAYQKALKQGVAHYPATASPGSVGNCFIFGHSSDYFWSKSDYKTALALLPQAKLGDEIKITDAGGVVYNYKIISSKVIGAEDTSVLTQDTGGKSLLTVQTSYPLGTAWKRWVVQAELIK
jgi:LPXTG-site transpeptidase (sortase) family protein